MSWEQKLARQFKDRDNPMKAPYTDGEVVSADPLKVSIYDGAVLLEGEALRRLDPFVWNGSQGGAFPLKALEAGQRVLLLGDQVFTILGVLT